MRIAAVAAIIVAAALALVWRARRQAAAAADPVGIAAADPDRFSPRGFDFYVRLDAPRRAATIDAVRRAVGSGGTVYDQQTHAVVLWNDFKPPEELLARLSADLKTQVIWLAFQKQVDAFGYERWEHGRRLRRLAFGCYDKERTWEQVDGDAEDWEAAAIFDMGRLESRLARARQIGSPFTADEEARLRRIWADRRIAIDSEDPGIDGRDVAEAVATAYGLPGWEQP